VPDKSFPAGIIFMKAFEDLGALADRLYNSTAVFADYIKEAWRAKNGIISHKFDVFAGAVFMLPGLGSNASTYVKGLPVNPLDLAYKTGDPRYGMALAALDVLAIIGACLVVDGGLLNRGVASYLAKKPKEDYAILAKSKK
jgi:hypothetical protein